MAKKPIKPKAHPTATRLERLENRSADVLQRLIRLEGIAQVLTQVVQQARTDSDRITEARLYKLLEQWRQPQPEPVSWRQWFESWRKRA